MSLKAVIRSSRLLLKLIEVERSGNVGYCQRPVIKAARMPLSSLPLVSTHGLYVLETLGCHDEVSG